MVTVFLRRFVLGPEIFHLSRHDQSVHRCHPAAGTDQMRGNITSLTIGALKPQGDRLYHVNQLFRVGGPSPENPQEFSGQNLFCHRQSLIPAYGSYPEYHILKNFRQYPPQPKHYRQPKLFITD
jgi:hypothetical protein